MSGPGSLGACHLSLCDRGAWECAPVPAVSMLRWFWKEVVFCVVLNKLIHSLSPLITTSSCSGLDFFFISFFAERVLLGWKL